MLYKAVRIDEMGNSYQYELGTFEEVVDDAIHARRACQCTSYYDINADASEADPVFQSFIADHDGVDYSYHLVFDKDKHPTVYIHYDRDKIKDDIKSELADKYGFELTQWGEIPEMEMSASEEYIVLVADRIRTIEIDAYDALDAQWLYDYVFGNKGGEVWLEEDDVHASGFPARIDYKK